MKPREFDVVQLLRPLPEHGFPAGARGVVVLDYTKYSNQDLPPAYEIEFTDAAGITQAVATVSEDNLEVVWRPGQSG